VHPAESDVEPVIRTAGIVDLDELVKLRMEFLTEIHPHCDDALLERMKERTSTYFGELFGRNEYVGFLGTIDGETVCAAGLVIYSLPPLDCEALRRIGHVLNFYTRPAFRRMGFGTRLIEYIKATAKSMGIFRIVLNATPSGVSVYRKAGFNEPSDRYMFMDL
jgi:ribosomal protein S18 acetylase RimI-like enzyme